MMIYVTASMRSGSTHLCRTLQKLFNYRMSSPRIGYAGRASTDDHQIDYSVLRIQHIEQDYVLHQHAKATGNNLFLLKQFEFTPIVLQRKLLDCLVSVFDQMPANPHMTVPGVFRPQWNGMKDEERWSWIAYNVIPWYLSYYASWHYADIEKYHVWYEDFYKDQPNGLKKILSFLKVENNIDDDLLKKASEAETASRHVGVSGRGQLVPGSVKDVAEQMISSWGPLSKKMRKDLL